jgi:hypothetical protein
VSVAPELRFARTAIDEERARALAEQLHRGRLDRGGAPLIHHVRRVAAAVSGDARVVAWLHEVLEYAAVSEESLLVEGVSNAELRALRLLTRDTESRSIARYLGHVRLIADAVGPGAGIARQVKHADLVDRVAHPAGNGGDLAPPYALGLAILRRAGLPTDAP